MPPTRRTTRTTPATTTTPTTTVTNAQLQALIDQGVAAALAERDASRSRDGDNSHGTKESFLADPMGRKDGICFPFISNYAIKVRSDCPKLKNGNQGNRAGNGNAVARAYVVGSAGTNPNSNVVTGTFLLNNRYASILFDTGADRSFISTAFSSLIDIIPTTLDHGYDG
ncbi:putative reverse transcriptase domain-containing protein [Tanacetum coccineum]